MTFRAKYDGHCHECKTRPTCPKCWEVQAVNGACGCDPE